MTKFFLVFIILFPLLGLSQPNIALGFTKEKVISHMAGEPLYAYSGEDCHDSTCFLVYMDSSSNYLAFHVVNGICETVLMYLPDSDLSHFEAYFDESYQKSPEVPYQWISPEGIIVGFTRSADPTGKDCLTLISYKP